MLSLALPMSAAAPLAKKAGGANTLTASQVVAKPLKAKKSDRSIAKVGSRQVQAGSQLATAKTGKASPKRTAAPLLEGASVAAKGYLCFENTWSNEEQPYGLVDLNLASGAYSKIATWDGQGGLRAVNFDDAFYIYADVEFWGMYFGTTSYKVDPRTGDVLETASVSGSGINCTAICYDNATGANYAVGYVTEETAGFGTFDPVTYTFTPISGDWAETAAGLAVYDGKAYVVMMTTGDFGEVDLTTGALTVIKTAALPETQYVTSACVDPKTGDYYFLSQNDYETGVYKVDKTTGEATKLGDVANESEITGLYIPVTPEAGAPAEVENLQIVTEGGSLAYKVEFDVPATYFDGSAASGDVTYKVIANGETTEGTTTFGAHAVVDMTAPAAGTYQVVVTLSNEAGESYKTRTEAYVGEDVPTAVKNVTLTKVDDSNFKLTWTGCEGANGGYFDTTLLSYSVLDMNGAEIATELTATEVTIPYTAPQSMTQYQYQVMAEYNGQFMAPVASNVLVLGNVALPYLNTFDTTAEQEAMTIIDNNGDGKTWTFVDGAARYSYSTSKQGDDWLITPALPMKAGEAYELSLRVRGNSTAYEESFEVYMGTEATAAAMTIELIPNTSLLTKEYDTYTATIVPPADGDYHVGIHATSEADQYYLFVDDLSISGAINTAVPSVVTDVVVTPGANGAKSATISLKAPTTDLVGNALTEDVTVKVSRATTTVGEETVAPGAAVTIEDANAPAGEVTYTIVASNSEGVSKLVSVKTFIGYTVPADLSGVKAAAGSNDGEVKLTWTAVTEDANGLAFSAGDVTYNVYEAEGSSRVLVAEGVTAAEYTYQVCAADAEQDFHQWLVFPVSEAGEGAGDYSEMIPLGKPYTLPYKESFTDKSLGSIFMISYPDPSAKFTPGIYGEDSGIETADGDNGMIIFQAQYIGCAGELTSGMIEIPAGIAPQLSFYTLSLELDNGGENENTVDAYVICEGQKTLVKAVDCKGPEGWVRHHADLSAYAGKKIQLSFYCEVVNCGLTGLDAIKVAVPLDNDLVISKLVGPASVKAGEDVEITAKVSNEGALVAADFTVDFYCNDEKFDTQYGHNLASGANESFMCTISTDVFTEDTLDVYAVVTYDADEDVDSNTTPTLSVQVEKSTLPAPEGLAATVADNGDVELSWDAINFGEPVAVNRTDDIEDGEDNAHEYKDWTFVDADGSAVGGFQGFDIPGINVGQSTASFFVFNKEELTGENPTFDAHSGVKYLAALFRYDDGTTSDWAISPELTGAAQTISFWAKSYSGTYPEQIEMYYTTAQSVDPADFVKVSAFGSQTVPDEWTLYNVELPAGATHFAIHSCATGSFMLMLDDITYECLEGMENPLGYNVYRDGVKINGEPVDTNAYTDTDATEGEHTYHVTAVYAKGESKPSAGVTVAVSSGIANIGAKAVSVKVVNHAIVVSGAEGKTINVHGIDGKAIAVREGAAVTTVKVVAGTYVVTIDGKAVKVIVK